MVQWYLSSHTVTTTPPIYFQAMRDFYEAFAITSFFTLLCSYMAPDIHSQKEYFRGTKPKKWVWPMSWVQKCSGGEPGCGEHPEVGSRGSA
jgi:hypothetical protein